MKFRLIRLRFRRRLRKGQRQVEDLGTQTEQHIERHLFKRFEHLRPVRRFVIGWLGLMTLLIAVLITQNLSLSSYYQTVRTVPGGIYNEGVLGRFTNANPLYATSDADATVSRLIFAGLLTYDNQGRLIGDLASDYKLDTHGSTYTVHLKPNLKWQDGQPLTSADVVFTYQLIQNPDAKSPLQSAWQGIDVSAPDAQTVVFKLPGILASFPHNMTNGIVPKHLLADILPAELRSADFNTVNPVGAGPFVWQAVQVKGDGNPSHTEEQIGLLPFDHYQGGKPQLQKFVVRIFADKDQMIEQFTDKQLMAVEGLASIPDNVKGNDHVIRHDIPLRAATMVFFKTSEGILANVKVRQALVRGADVPQITKDLGYPTRLVREPFLLGQLGYTPSLTQPTQNIKKAQAILDSDGWKLQQGTRSKDKQKLSFTLTAADTPDYHVVVSHLQRQWNELGVKLNARFLDPTDFQTALTYHDYEAILYGISIGSDPDVFVYWDSSQADIRAANRLNLSEYKNPKADIALEAGRTRLDPILRTVKYKPFLQAWQQDAPALALYQPRVLYLTNGFVSGLSDQPINTATDRFNNVQNWQIREAKVTD